MKKVEYILCAAIWYKEITLVEEIPQVRPINCDKGIVVLGHRHGQCIWTVKCLTGKRTVQISPDGVGITQQGFLTNKNRFVDREEAAEIAYKAKQIISQVASLFSEDLY